MQRLKRIIEYCLFIVCIVILVFANTGMTEPIEEKDKEQTIDEKTTDNEKPDAEEKESEKGYIYDPAGKTDPFKSFIVVRKEVMKKEDEKPKTYLETLELSQLTLSVQSTNHAPG